MAARLERIQSILNEICTGNPDITGAAVVSEEGLIIASNLPAGIDEQRVSAVFAALQSIAERAAEQIGLGKITRMMVFAEKGGALMCSGGKASLVIFIRQKAKLGLVLMDASDAYEKLSELLK